MMDLVIKVHIQLQGISRCMEIEILKTPRLKGSLDETKWIRTIDPQFRKLMLYPAEL